MKSIAIINAPRVNEVFYPDAYLDKIVAALTNRGVRAKAVAWCDDEVHWSTFDGAVLRSPWDVYFYPNEFRAWLDRISEHMPTANPASVVRWAFDKTYLCELQQKDVPVVPTQVVEADGSTIFPATSFVIKPALSGGGLNSAHYDHSQVAEALSHAAKIREDGGIPLVQPYLTEVDTAGECGLLFFGGQFSHAIRKSAVLSTQNTVRTTDTLAVDVDAFHPDLEPHTPTALELEIARRALAALPEPTVFARVDMITSYGTPHILELEAIDPDLFFHMDSGAFDRYIQTLVNWSNSI